MRKDIFTNTAGEVEMDLDDRQVAEIEFAKTYAETFHHGTDGHSRLMLIAKLAWFIEEIGKLANQEVAHAD
jgi:hypothetical protein